MGNACQQIHNIGGRCLTQGRSAIEGERLVVAHGMTSFMRKLFLFA
jgi:hypothetical protein